MRISTYMMQQQMLRGLGRSLDSLARAQQDAATGRRVRTLSDHPVDASQIMRIDSHLRDIDQFNRNAAAAQTRLSAEDVVLTAARDLVSRAKNLALSGATESPSDPLRLAALAELRQIRDQLVSLGNTRIGDEYIFGGAQTQSPPFRADGAYLGDDTIRMAEIDDQVIVPTNHSGGWMFGPAFQALDALEQELQTGTSASIQGLAADLDTADRQMLYSQTEVGSRQREIESALEHLARRSNDLLDRREVLRDLDPAEAVAKVLAGQTALERAYAMVGRVLSTNFLDYLR
jgi:flagellar hook-associated protein 3 FlgL